jgi:hypothetical protein
MLAIERTNSVNAYNFINPLSVEEKLSNKNLRQPKVLTCDAETYTCPNCSQETKLTSTYSRMVYHLSETIIYEVYYYYCYHCKMSWPSIPVYCLPNISIGIDVIGHVAKYHVLHGQAL